MNVNFCTKTSSEFNPQHVVFYLFNSQGLFLGLVNYPFHSEISTIKISVEGLSLLTQCTGSSIQKIKERVAFKRLFFVQQPNNVRMCCICA